MTEQRITAIALKVLGVFSIVRSLEYLGQIIGNLAWSGDQILSNMAVFLMGFLPFLFLNAAAFILLRHADALATKLLSSNGNIASPLTAPGEGWYLFAFTVTGVVLLIWDIPANLAQLIANFSIPELEKYPGTHSSAQRGGWILLIRTLIEIGAGLYLVLGSGQLVRMLRKIRKE